MAVRTMGLYLSRWGFAPQKPMRKAYEQSPAAVKKWHEGEYPIIAAGAKAEGAKIPLLVVETRLYFRSCNESQRFNQ